MLGLLVSAGLASPLLSASFFMLGASCLWVRQAEPVFWIWQKSMFLLGGLLWPLALYPPAVRLPGLADAVSRHDRSTRAMGAAGRGMGTGGGIPASDFLGVAIVLPWPSTSGAVAAGHSGGRNGMSFPGLCLGAAGGQLARALHQHSGRAPFLSGFMFAAEPSVFSAVGDLFRLRRRNQAAGACTTYRCSTASSPLRWVCDVPVPTASEPCRCASRIRASTRSS